jgi:hypothetical protein
MVASLEWAEIRRRRSSVFDATLAILMLLMLALIATVLGAEHHDLG